ncbi:hypothetical protein BKA80DRAFT_256146 [Phyllosticta citrichinensis]
MAGKHCEIGVLCDTLPGFLGLVVFWFFSSASSSLTDGARIRNSSTVRHLPDLLVFGGLANRFRSIPFLHCVSFLRQWPKSHSLTLAGPAHLAFHQVAPPSVTPSRASNDRLPQTFCGAVSEMDQGLRIRRVGWSVGFGALLLINEARAHSRSSCASKESTIATKFWVRVMAEPQNWKSAGEETFSRRSNLAKASVASRICLR